jgi:peptidoglycan/LPS O-acetylase OafA/YrhL
VTTRAVVAIVLGALGVALIVAAAVVSLTDHDLPNVTGNLLVMIVGALILIAGVAVGAASTSASSPEEVNP